MVPSTMSIPTVNRSQGRSIPLLPDVLEAPGAVPAIFPLIAEGASLGCALGKSILLLGDDGRYVRFQLLLPVVLQIH